MHAAVVVGGVDVVVHRARPAGPCRAPGRRRPCRAPPSSAAPVPCTPGRKMPSPISQSASSAVWPSSRCLRQEPNTSETDSLSAPGLALVGQAGGVLGDRVGQLVAEHVDRLGEPARRPCRRRRRRPAGCRPRRRCRSPARSAPWRPPGRPGRRRTRGRRPRENSARVASTPTYASSTAGSPDAGSPARPHQLAGQVGAVVRRCAPRTAARPPRRRRAGEAAGAWRGRRAAGVDPQGLRAAATRPGSGWEVAIFSRR